MFASRRLEQNGYHIADDIFNRELLKNSCIMIGIFMKFVSKGPILMTALIQVINIYVFIQYF